jgi:transposase InsO family protein
VGTWPRAELINTILDPDINKVAASAEQPMLHSDRGGHYPWSGWLTRIADAKLVRSMPRKESSPDNAACDGFFGRLPVWGSDRQLRGAEIRTANVSSGS